MIKGEFERDLPVYPSRDPRSNNRGGVLGQLSFRVTGRKPWEVK